MASTNPAFFETLAAGISANSNAISTAVSNTNLPDLNARIAANMSSLSALAGTAATNSAAVSTNAAGIQANSVRITSNATANDTLVNSLGFLSFQVQDNLASNIMQDGKISTNSASIAALS